MAKGEQTDIALQNFTVSNTSKDTSNTSNKMLTESVIKAQGHYMALKCLLNHQGEKGYRA